MTQPTEWEKKRDYFLGKQSGSMLEVTRLVADWARAETLKEVEELDLRIENLSALLRRCFRWAKTREPSIACEKIVDLSNKAQHLLSPVSVFRDSKLKGKDGG